MEREGGEFKGRKTRDVNTRQKHREENGRRPTAAGYERAETGRKGAERVPR